MPGRKIYSNFFLLFLPSCLRNTHSKSKESKNNVYLHKGVCIMHIWLSTSICSFLRTMFVTYLHWVILYNNKDSNTKTRDFSLWIISLSRCKRYHNLFSRYFIPQIPGDWETLERLRLLNSRKSRLLLIPWPPCILKLNIWMSGRIFFRLNK